MLDRPLPPRPDPAARPRRRGVRIGAAIVVLLLAGAAAAYLVARRDRAPARTAAPAVGTARVVRTTLVESVMVGGTLGYGDPQPLDNRLTGTLTSVASPGVTVRSGGQLYTVDTRPVLLLRGPLPAYRPMQPGLIGSDVLQLEENLSALGYTGFTVNTEYTDATAAAVRRWQDSLHIEQTGTVPLGQVVFLRGDLRVAEATAHPGQMINQSTEVLSYTDTARVVTADLSVAQRTLVHPGDQVTITLPGSKTVAGVVANVGTVATAPPDNGGGQNGAGSWGEQLTVKLTCAIADQGALGNLDSSPVRVALSGQRRANVLAVPVAALLALREGDYGVRVRPGDGEARIIPVRTGLFAGGLVEVSAPGLAEGDLVETAPS